MKNLTISLLLITMALCRSAVGGEIHDAARAGDVAKVTAILTAHPDLINAHNQNGFLDLTPLIEAAAANRKAVVELLLARGADVNAKNRAGCAPLHGAAQSNHKDIAELLLAHKADVNAKQNDGNTPLHLAAGADPDNKDTAELLLSHKADVTAKDNDGNTPLHRAAGNGNKNIINFLLTHGADVNAKNKAGQTPAQVATEFIHPDAAKLLQPTAGK